MVGARHAPSCFYPHVTHVINFTRLPPFSACNIENLREAWERGYGIAALSVAKVEGHT